MRLIMLCFMFFFAAGFTSLSFARDASVLLNRQNVIIGKDAEALRTKVLPAISQPNRENLQALTLELGDLPEDAARQALWLIASASDNIDILSIYSSVLKLENPLLRQDALDILIAHGSGDGMRLVFSHLSTEPDSKVREHILNAVSNLSSYNSIQNLINIVDYPGIDKEIQEQTVSRLNSLTGANLGIRVKDWFEWWEKNSNNYK